MIKQTGIILSLICLLMNHCAFSTSIPEQNIKDENQEDLGRFILAGLLEGTGIALTGYSVYTLTHSTNESPKPVMSINTGMVRTDYETGEDIYEIGEAIYKEGLYSSTHLGALIGGLLGGTLMIVGLIVMLVD